MAEILVIDDDPDIRDLLFDASAGPGTRSGSPPTGTRG